MGQVAPLVRQRYGKIAIDAIRAEAPRPTQSIEQTQPMIENVALNTV
ncbi:MAG: hypothetical protein ACR5LG_00735 [Sodalis sp. (in: enterobacteria)]